MKSLTIYISFAWVVLSFQACNTQKILTSETHGNAAALITTDTTYEHVIKVDDKITVSIWNHSNYSLGSAYTVHNTNESYGKWILVDKDGNLPLPDVGMVNIAGLTCSEAKVKLEDIYGEKLVDPIISVRVLNREFTILGEVTAPGNYIMEKERNSITEAIGKANGFTTYSNLKQVQLIRNDTNYVLDFRKLHEDVLHRINIQAGDVIIVPEKGSKRVNLNAPTMIAFSSAITAIVLVISIMSQP
ncbi:MAG: polysaccharide biosynthesis/export family protein [Salibacteraceae bacterium]